MSEDNFTVEENIATESGLAALYAYGWGFQQCYEECAKLTAEVSDVKEEQDHYEKILHQVKENMCIDSCVQILLDHTYPSEKGGVFEINDKLANPLDGHSLVALEILYRSYLDLAGKLENMDYDIPSVLNIQNAQSFFSDWVNAKKDQALTIRGIGNHFPLYFTPSEERGSLPSLDKPAMINAISDHFPDISEERKSELVEDLYDGLDHISENLKSCLGVRQQWSKVIGMQQEPGMAIS